METLASDRVIASSDRCLAIGGIGPIFDDGYGVGVLELEVFGRWPLPCLCTHRK